MPQLKAAIFDLDGTLVSSALDFQLMRSRIGCPLGTDILQYVDQLAESDKAAAIATIQQIELEEAHSATRLPGAKDLIDHLHHCNIPTAIVTRNFAQAARIKLDNNQLNIPLVLTRDDAPAKPDPAALLMIAKQWQIPAPQITYVGDYLYDVQAANRAEMISCLYAPDELPEYADQADIICRHLHDLIELF